MASSWRWASARWASPAGPALAVACVARARQYDQAGSRSSAGLIQPISCSTAGQRSAGGAPRNSARTPQASVSSLQPGLASPGSRLSARSICVAASVDRRKAVCRAR